MINRTRKKILLMCQLERIVLICKQVSSSEDKASFYKIYIDKIKIFNFVKQNTIISSCYY